MVKSETAQRRARKVINRLAAFGAALLIVVMMMSALLRLRAAGLDCLDWPACYGKVQPTRAAYSIPRLLHRITAMAAMFAVVGIGVFASSHPRIFRRELAMSAVMFALLIGLAMLGRSSAGATTTIVPVGNVVGGMLLTAMFAWIALGDMRGALPAPGCLVALSWGTLFLALLQVALGVMTSASHSGLTCTGVLDCGTDRLWVGWAAGQFNPWREASPSIAVHAAHRIGALATLIMGLCTAYGLRRVSRVRAAALGTAVLMQSALGVTLVAYSLPLLAAVAHNTGAAVLLITIVAAHHAILRSRRGHAKLI